MENSILRRRVPAYSRHFLKVGGLKSLCEFYPPGSHTLSSMPVSTKQDKVLSGMDPGAYFPGVMIE